MNVFDLLSFSIIDRCHFFVISENPERGYEKNDKFICILIGSFFSALLTPQRRRSDELQKIRRVQLLKWKQVEYVHRKMIISS